MLKTSALDALSMKGLTLERQHLNRFIVAKLPYQHSLMIKNTHSGYFTLLTYDKKDKAASEPSIAAVVLCTS